MKVFILLSLAALALCQVNQRDRYPGFNKESGSERAVECTYWVGVEHSICHRYGFEVNNKPLKDFRPNHYYYGMMNHDMLLGNAQPDAEVCSDKAEKDNYWMQCPCTYPDFQYILDGGDVFKWEDNTACTKLPDPADRPCRKTCNDCGQDNYLSAKKTVDKTNELRCMKLADHFPFSCLEKRVKETPRPSVVSIFLNRVVMAPLCNSNTDRRICVSFNYRRRAGSECPPDMLSKIHPCVRQDTDYATYLTDGPSAACLTDDAYAALTGADVALYKRVELDDKGYCMFNIWRKAYFDFEVDTDTCQADVSDADDSENGIELTITVYREVDHTDIDEVEVRKGPCSGLATDIVFPDTPPAAGNGVLHGIENVE